MVLAGIELLSKHLNDGGFFERGLVYSDLLVYLLLSGYSYVAP